MSTSKLNRFWTAVTILLVTIIVAGGIILLSRYRPAQPMEISLPPSQEWQGTIHIDGSVGKPGFYPLRGGDSIDALIQAAGGVDNSANLTSLELYIGPEENEGAQKVDINRAEAWLLEALPGIGETLAKRIVDFRRKNGPFRSTEELLKVPGIGTSAYERIRGLITVGE